MNICTGRFCYFLFVVSVDDENSKDVLAINEVRLSAHKGEHPDDSEDYAAIGLSSEEEAEDLPDSQYIRRKYRLPWPPLLSSTLCYVEISWWGVFQQGAMIWCHNHHPDSV